MKVNKKDRICKPISGEWMLSRFSEIAHINMKRIDFIKVRKLINEITDIIHNQFLKPFLGETDMFIK